MLKIVALYICLTVFLVSVTGNDSNPVVPTNVTEAITPEPVPTTAVTPSSSPAPLTTVAPDTTVAPTTTVAPNTTAAPTTTAAPITTVAPVTTVKPITTAAPNTTLPPVTTAAPSTTTVGPVTPAPAPQTGEWHVNGTNVTCIVVKMAVQFNVSYETTDNKTAWQELTMPTDVNSTVATGTCGDKEQTLNLTWHAGEDSLVIQFNKNETTGKYFMRNVEVTLGNHEFPNISSNASMEFNHDAAVFPTKLSNSYKCNRLQKVNLMRSGGNETVGWLQISNLQFQAFKSDKAANFGFAEDCSVDTPDLVPIAVGCALTTLVIIVLVAYLVGRRRSQSRGYLSLHYPEFVDDDAIPTQTIVLEFE